MTIVRVFCICQGENCQVFPHFFKPAWFSSVVVRFYVSVWQSIVMECTLQADLDYLADSVVGKQKRNSFVDPSLRKLPKLCLL